MKQLEQLLNHFQTGLIVVFVSLFISTSSNAQLFGGAIITRRQTIKIPLNITLGQNTSYYIASVQDADYLPYNPITVSASTDPHAADGEADPEINIQGAISTTGLTVKIPVTATGEGTIPAYSSTITVPANLTEDGIDRDLNLSWQAQAYTISTTSITATLKAVGGILNAKKLDINNGIGYDFLGVLLAAFNYPYNFAGNVTTFSVRDIAGIPDKMFGKADNGSQIRHNFLYVPVTGEDGRTWLNNNLGADYANTNLTSFNPGQQATAYNDFHAYGSLFQWGRKPDGHELVSWTNSTTGIAVNGNSPFLSNSPDHDLFINLGSSPSVMADWRVGSDGTLWAGKNGINNPCPIGFKVPTETELSNWVSAAHVTGIETASTANLKITQPGRRDYYEGKILFPGQDCEYWTSTAHDGGVEYDTNDRYKSVQRFFRDNTGVDYTGRAQGFPVRCILN